MSEEERTHENCPSGDSRCWVMGRHYGCSCNLEFDEIQELRSLLSSREDRVKVLEGALKKACVFLWSYYREQHKRMDGHIALALKMAAHEVDAALTPKGE